MRKREKQWCGFSPSFRGASEPVILSAAGAKDLLFGFADTQMYQRILRSRGFRAGT